MLDADLIEDLSIGSAVLGTGGGGDPYIGKLIAIEAVNRYGPVEVIPASALDDDDQVIVVGMSGAPTVITEKIPGGHELDIVFNMATTFSGRMPRARCWTAARSPHPRWWARSTQRALESSRTS